MGARAVEIAGLLRSGWAVRIQVFGQSMLWAIPPGAIIEVVPCAPEQLGRGDVVLYQRHDRIVAHRIVAIAVAPDGQKFLVRGDNLDACDQPVDASSVLGRVVLVDGLWRRALLLLRAMTSAALARARR